MKTGIMNITKDDYMQAVEIEKALKIREELSGITWEEFSNTVDHKYGGFSAYLYPCQTSDGLYKGCEFRFMDKANHLLVTVFTSVAFKTLFVTVENMDDYNGGYTFILDNEDIRENADRIAYREFNRVR